MARGAKALITPSVLSWARESSGFDLEEVAKAAGVKVAKLIAWEGGSQQPTIRQLRLLANKYKRPIAVFYLPEPPTDFQALRDYRRLPGSAPVSDSPALRLEIRRAQYRRDVAIELSRELGSEPPSFDVAGSIDDDPEELAERIRGRLGITEGVQRGWRQPYQALNGWRTLLERAGVLVFQFSKVSVEEARGFSIAEQPWPVVAVNVRDAPRGRVFSMLHELTHVVLRQGGLCDLTGPRDIEVFCNHVAGAVIAPASDMLRNPLVTGHVDPVWPEDILVELSRQYGASRETILRRLLVLGRTSQQHYEDKREFYLSQYRKLRRDAAGFAPPDRLALSRVGPLFAGLVLDGYDQEKITASRVSDYLEVKLQHLGKIRDDLVPLVAIGTV